MSRSCAGKVLPSSPLWRFVRFLPVLLLAVACTSRSSANEAGASDDIARLILAARPGELITLPAGNHGLVRLEGKHWTTQVVVDARNARLRLIVNDVRNLRFIGGTFADANGRGPDGYAARIVLSRGITMESARFTNATRGLVVDRSEDVTLRNLFFTGLRAEGVNLALSRKILLEKIHCNDFRPEPPDHPDCVQAWSRPSARPSADITVRDVSVNGKMQGVFFGNHIRDGVDDGGFDRVTVTGAEILTTYPNGVAVFDCRECTITDNAAFALPDARRRTQVRIERCTNCTVARNRDDLTPDERARKR